MTVQTAFDQFRANPLRTVLATLGVVIGVGALVAVLALGDGFEATMRRMAARDGRLHSVTASPRTTDRLAGEVVARAGAAELPLDDLAQLRTLFSERIEGDVDARIWTSGVALIDSAEWIPGAGLEALPVLAVSAPDPERADSLLQSGRFFSAEEAAAGVPLAVISDSAARLLAGEAGSPIPETLRLSGEVFTIIGVLRRDAPEGSRVIAAVPLQLADQALLPAPGVRRPALQLRAERIEDVLPAKEVLESWLALQFGAGWRDSVVVRSYEREAEQGTQGILLFKLFMGAITGISLVVGGIGIMNVLLASISERTREIGIRRAVGARRRDVLRQFLAESIIISSVGGLLGAAFGVAAATAATAIMRRLAMVSDMQPGFSISTILVVSGAALGVGILFGVYPAVRAARLNPIDALRHE